MRSTATAERPLTHEARWPAGTFLEALAPASRTALLGLGVGRNHSNGDILLGEQEHSNHVVLLCRAVVKMTAGLENGRSSFLGIKVGGDTVGEMAALSGEPRCATVTVCGDARVRIIQRDDFLRYLHDFPDAHTALTCMIMKQLNWANKRRSDFSGYPAFVRLARALDGLVDAHGRRGFGEFCFDIGLTQRELGALVGVEEDTARRELRRLRDQGVIRLGYRSVAVVDRQALAAIAYGPVSS